MAKKKTTPDELDNPSTTPPPLPIETVSESEPVETAKSPKQTKSKAPAPAAESSARKKKRIVIMAGSRGGTGKTTAAVGINEFYDSLGISVKRFDFEAENKEASSFSHFYKEATRHDLRDRDSMDTLTQDMTIHDSPVIFADFGAGSQQETIAWFTRFYPRLTQRNIAFTLVGVIDGDIGATLGILEWADKTKDFPNIDWIIVLNSKDQPREKFNNWNKVDDVQQFIERAKPAIVTMMSRNDTFQNIVRQQGALLNNIANEKFDVHPTIQPKDNPLNQIHYIIHASDYLTSFNEQLKTIASTHLLP